VSHLKPCVIPVRRTSVTILCVPFYTRLSRFTRTFVLCLLRDCAMQSSESVTIAVFKLLREVIPLGHSLRSSLFEEIGGFAVPSRVKCSKTTATPFFLRGFISRQVSPSAGSRVLFRNVDTSDATTRIKCYASTRVNFYERLPGLARIQSTSVVCRFSGNH